MSSNRWLIGAALLLALVIGGSIALGMSRRGEVEFAADSPEGTVQRYVRAVEDQDADAIRQTLSPAAQQRCDLSDIRNALRRPDERDFRVTLREVRMTGNDRAEVRVRVSESFGNGPFNNGSFDHEETFDLVRVGDAWLIDQPAWPIGCPPPGFPRGGVAPAVPVPATVTPTPGSVPTATPSVGTSTATPAPANR